MRYKLVLLTCLFAVLGAKAQTNEVQLDADGIMRVGAPVTIVTIGNSITAGYSNTSPYWAWPAQLGRMRRRHRSARHLLPRLRQQDRQDPALTPALPQRADIPENINEQLIVELYSK